MTRVGVLAALAACVLAAAPAQAQTAAPCTRYAATTGDDGAPGTLAAPLRTAQALADSIAGGGVGCLAPGTYGGGIVFGAGGTPQSRLVIQSAPGGRATIAGQIEVRQEAPFVTIQGLRLDGTNSDGGPSPLVNAAGAVFYGNNISNGSDTCFGLGDKSWGRAIGTVIEANQIHHCGVDGTNMDQGVYVREAVGTQVIGNHIHSNPDRGVQLYPNGDGSLVRGNLIDGNGTGVIFSGDDLDTADGNLVAENIITNSDLRWDVEHFYPNPLLFGVGNVVTRNCVWGGARGAFKPGAVGYVETQNHTDPGSCPLTPPVLPASAR
jgi:hypothetical protein